MASNSITLEIQSSNSVDLSAKKEALQNIASLDTNVIAFLGKLAKSPKAVSKLMNNKLLIEKMVF